MALTLRLTLTFSLRLTLTLNVTLADNASHIFTLTFNLGFNVKVYRIVNVKPRVLRVAMPRIPRGVDLVRVRDAHLSKD